jgi:hypothetical protein
MRLLRVAPAFLMAGLIVGGYLLTLGTGAAVSPPWSTGGEAQILLWGGVGLLGGCTALFVVVLWGAVYLQVMEGSRGLPPPEPIDDPSHRPATGLPAADLARLQLGPDGLAGLGFEPAGWFLLDNFARLRVGAWRHAARPEVAFVLFQYGGGARLRIVRRFPGGVILITTNRLVDVSIATPASTYVQMRKTPSAAELWSWHLEAETLFEEGASLSRAGDERITRSPGDIATGPGWLPSFRALVPAEREGASTDLFMEILFRYGWFCRSRRLWLLRLNPFRECRRMYCLSGMSLKQQIAEGWAVAPGLRQMVCLPPGEGK